MKKTYAGGEWLENASRRMGIPGEIAGMPRIEIVGNSVNVENHRGILEYSEDEIDVSTRAGLVRIRGDRLEISSMGAEVLQVRGRVFSVELGD